MLISSCHLFLKKVLSLPAWFVCRGLVSLVLLLMLSTGCSQVGLEAPQFPVLLPNFLTDANFQIRVTPSSRSGVYTVAGSTNLPDESRITVAAIRYLRSSQSLSASLNQNPTYSILAYQDAEVKNGKWQATLNLWKVSPNGQFKEAWQLDQTKLGLSLDPDSDVTFLATLAPTDSLSELEPLLEKKGIKLVSNIVRNTSDGERYVQASQVLPIALPTGQTTLPAPKEEVNGGWGPRYLLLPEPENTKKLENPKERRTDAPLSPAEFLQ